MVINSYHLAILEASDDGQHMDLADCWRTYHIVSDMCDCELEIDEDLPGRGRDQATAPGGRPGVPKKLYVPVTRKVTDTDDSKRSKSECKDSLTNETVGLPEDHVYF